MVFVPHWFRALDSQVVVVIRNENDETEVVTDEPRSLANRRSPLPGIATSSPPTSYTTLPQAIAYPKLPQAIARNAGTPTLKLAKSPLPDISVDSVKATTPPAAEPPSGGGGGKHTVVYRTKQQRQVPSADHVLSKYEIGRKLGDGNFAVVKQATMIMNRVDYAMKIMDKVSWVVLHQARKPDLVSMCWILLYSFFYQFKNFFIFYKNILI